MITKLDRRRSQPIAALTALWAEATEAIRNLAHGQVAERVSDAIAVHFVANRQAEIIDADRIPSLGTPAVEVESRYLTKVICRLFDPPDEP